MDSNIYTFLYPIPFFSALVPTFNCRGTRRTAKGVDGRQYHNMHVPRSDAETVGGGFATHLDAIGASLYPSSFKVVRL